MKTKYEYEGKAQKIIPITIVQLENILRTIKEIIKNGNKLKHSQIMNLYDECVDLSKVESSTNWQEHIDNVINVWSSKVNI